MSNNYNIIVKLIIVIVVIILLFHSEIGLNITSYSDAHTKISNMLFLKDIDNIRKHTQDEINSAEEKGYTQEDSKVNPNDGPDLSDKVKENFDNFNGRDKKLYLFIPQIVYILSNFYQYGTELKTDYHLVYLSKSIIVTMTNLPINFNNMK